MIGESLTEPVTVRPLVLYVDDERANRVVFEQSLGGDFRIQVVADEHGYEGWYEFAKERDRLYALIRDTRTQGVCDELAPAVLDRLGPHGLRAATLGSSGSLTAASSDHNRTGQNRKEKDCKTVVN